MIVADSDILIDALRGREPTGERMAAALRAGSVSTTAISRFELLSGARTQREREKVALLLGPMSILSFDDAAAGIAAEVRRRLERSGTGIGMADYLIAGICLSRQADLWTRNHAHFARIPDLRCCAVLSQVDQYRLPARFVVRFAGRLLRR